MFIDSSKLIPLELHGGQNARTSQALGYPNLSRWVEFILRPADLQGVWAATGSRV